MKIPIGTHRSACPKYSPPHKHRSAPHPPRADEVRIAPDVLECEHEIVESGSDSPAREAEPLKLIVTAPDPAERDKLKKLFLDENPDNRIGADLPLINGFAVEVSPSSIQILPELGKTAHDVRVSLDGEVSIPEQPDQPDQHRPPTASLNLATHAMGLDQLWARGLTGKGVTIAVIDTGIAPHPDLVHHIIDFKDYVNGKSEAYDDSGHGTHVSSICAGDGRASAGAFKGCAPEASLIGIKVLDKNGKGSVSKIIEAIQWAIDNKDRYHIGVINLSLGGPPTQSYEDDPMAQAAEAAAADGLVVCAAAGNNGPTAKTINTPGIAPDAFTVGSLDDMGTVTRSDDVVANSSGRGPTPFDGLPKPDFVAPGVGITAADWRSDGYRTMSGTSMATPMVSGAVAVLLQARPDLTPSQIKQLLMQTATRVESSHDPNAQGSGFIDPVHALASSDISIST